MASICEADGSRSPASMRQMAAASRLIALPSRACDHPRARRWWRILSPTESRRVRCLRPMRATLTGEQFLVKEAMHELRMCDAGRALDLLHRGDPIMAKQGSIPKSWRDAVIAKLVALKMKDAELARRLGCKNPEDIHHLLKAKKPRQWSKWARPVAEYLGIPLPEEPSLESWESSWLDAGRVVHQYDPSWPAEIEQVLRERVETLRAVAKSDQSLTAALRRHPSDRRGKP